MNDSARIPEILAPAGGREQFFAALNSGADAVFLGLKSFNARARAENFTSEDLSELVPLAHQFGMKVLVTLNTLIKEKEIPDLIRVLFELESCGVDAVIVQDIAVASLIRQHFPSLRIHASTQLAVHNLAGVLKARDLGFRRVVLAREMTAVELRKIKNTISSEEIEIEVFCHGSLCYSYSGLCFFSGSEDSRSGNRGECSYTCRQPYYIEEEKRNAFLFSMKDLDTAQNIDQFIRAGIDTLKIEGRKKDAQYVASTVRLYRTKLDEFFGHPTLRKTAPKQARDLYNRADTDQIAMDLALSFRREPTTLFVQGRYHENVIDLNNSTHLGVEIGIISQKTEKEIYVKLTGPVERFDGIRLLPSNTVNHESRYNNHVLEFSLRDLFLKKKKVFSAKAGDEIKIPLPDNKIAISVGDNVYKIRSNQLKQRVSLLTKPPENIRLRAFVSIETELSAVYADNHLEITFTASKLGQLICRESLKTEAIKPHSIPTLKTDLEKTFQIFGNIGYLSSRVTFNGDFDWFIPRTVLKRFKEICASALQTCYSEWSNRRRTSISSSLANKELSPNRDPLTEEETAFVDYRIKFDRLDYIDPILAFCRQNPSFLLEELIFEPKRAFLTDLEVRSLTESLIEKTKNIGIKLRISFPTVIRAWDEPLLSRWIQSFHENGICNFEIGNIGALRLIDSWRLDRNKLDLSGDFTLYALNSQSTRAWFNLGLSFVTSSIEDDNSNFSNHFRSLNSFEQKKIKVILYKDTPLFIAEACSLTAIHNGCPTAKVCGYRTLTIKNPKGETFYVAHESCKSVVYSKDAFSLTDRQAELISLGVKHFQVDFLTRPYSGERITQILNAVVSQSRIDGTHNANWNGSLL